MLLLHSSGQKQRAGEGKPSTGRTGEQAGAVLGGGKVAGTRSVALTQRRTDDYVERVPHTHDIARLALR